MLVEGRGQDVLQLIRTAELLVDAGLIVIVQSETSPEEAALIAPRPLLGVDSNGPSEQAANRVVQLVLQRS